MISSVFGISNIIRLTFFLLGQTKSDKCLLIFVFSKMKGRV